MGSLICALVCFGIPGISFLFFWRKKDGYVLSFFTGALVFAVFQLFTRIPLLNMVLPKMNWFLIMTVTSPVLTVLFYAFTAGLFEEVGRFAGLRLLRRGRTSWLDGAAFGLGHGGMEALWIGATVFASGQADQMNYAVVAFERFFSIGVHMGLTFVVLNGIRLRKIRYLFLAILLHTVLDVLAPVITNLWVSEGIVMLCGAAAYIYVGLEKKKEDKEYV